jgi:hypothetical protein
MRAMALRRIFRWFERPGGDFTKGGNHVVRSVDEATDWLAERLAVGPVTWTRAELTSVIARFVEESSLEERNVASSPSV